MLCNSLLSVSLQEVNDIQEANLNPEWELEDQHEEVKVWINCCTMELQQQEGKGHLTSIPSPFLGKSLTPASTCNTDACLK